MIFIIQTQTGYWGKGKTVTEAKAQVKKAGAGANDPCYLFSIEGDDNAFVDEYGATHRKENSLRTTILGDVKLRILK